MMIVQEIMHGANETSCPVPSPAWVLRHPPVTRLGRSPVPGWSAAPPEPG